MLVGLPRCFGRPELCRAYLLSSGEFLNYIEDRRNKESADEGLRHHATDHGRTDNLARDGARSGCCPEWHAPDNEGERGHHEGPGPKPRYVQRSEVRAVREM